MKKIKLPFIILFTCIAILCLTSILNTYTCLAQGEWPAYTQNVLLYPIIQYIQAATLPGSIIVSGCWGYPWFTMPGSYFPPSTNWFKKSYYMYYPPIGWFDSYIYPFGHIYNVADPYRDFPNISVLINNPATWATLPLDMFLNCTDPICYYLGGGIHFFSGAVSTPYLISVNNSPSIDPALLKYLSLMGLFDYNVPSRLAPLPLPAQ